MIALLGLSSLHEFASTVYWRNWDAPGYEGLKGESAATWDDAIGDSIVNESGSSDARYRGHRDGQRERLRIEAERNAK